MAVDLEFFTDPADFLAVATDRLTESPVESTVVATVAHRAARELSEGIEQPAHDWYVAARDGGDVVGLGMRTASFEPRPLFLLPMPDDAAVTLARTLHDRGEDVRAANGALPTVAVFADETARLTGRTSRINIHTRLFELADLVSPKHVVPGGLREATADDLDLVKTWFAAFMADADEQAGRPPGGHAEEAPDDESTLRRIASGYVWLWESQDGRRVSLVAANPPALGVSRIGPVYTPRDERGKGWASAAVAAVSQHLLDLGARPCLFTDQANPTSNGIYLALGYRPVVDMAFLVVD